MAGRVEHHYVLVCDGCGAEVGADGSHSTATSARGEAYSLGWRFPQGLKASGGYSSLANDVCPDCAPGWMPMVVRRKTKP